MTGAATRSNRGRVQARRCAVQALYQWLLTDRDPVEIVREFRMDRELGRIDTSYFERLAGEIPHHFPELRALLDTVLDRDWSMINPVERAVLLVGVYELAHCPEVPRRVVLNEAIELVKRFGAEEGYRYVNAVLDKVSHAARRIEYEAESRAG